MSTLNESIQVAAEIIAKHMHHWLPGVKASNAAKIIQETCFTLRPMSDAPRDGTYVLLKMKVGMFFVANNRGFDDAWKAPAPIGYDCAIADEWIEGWMPLPGTLTAFNKENDDK